MALSLYLSLAIPLLLFLLLILWALLHRLKNKWFTERKNGRVAGYWWFNIQYAEDAGIEYSYHYDPNAGMRCRIRHIGDHLPSSERLYYPLDGYVTLP